MQGFSVYPGLDNTLEENLALIEAAGRHGLKRMFMSLHIPETDAGRFHVECRELLAAAVKADMEIISDVSPAVKDVLGLGEDFCLDEAGLAMFRQMGIHTLRLDYGYGAEEIARLSRNGQGVKIQLNASTINGKILQGLASAGADFGNIDALHNFYPREGTGIGEATLGQKTALLHDYGIRVGAFVASDGRKRAPLRVGLPTMEDHRQWPFDLAARHLIALGIDDVLVGDSLPLDSELAALGTLEPDTVCLGAEACTEEAIALELLANVFTAREDEARDAIRAQESRVLLKQSGWSIAPQVPAATRSVGTVTLDNVDYMRYMGELQIMKREAPADSRVNVVAHILPEEQFLMGYITPGRRFRIVL